MPPRRAWTAAARTSDFHGFREVGRHGRTPCRSINERIVFHAILTTVKRHPALRTVLRQRLLRHYREYRKEVDPHILEIRDLTGSGGEPE